MGTVVDLKAPSKTGLPCDRQAEEALLGTILCEASKLEVVSEFLSPEMFHWPLHGRVYGAVVDAIQRVGRADTITVAHSLRGDQEFEQVGGSGYLLDLVEKLETLGAVQDVAKIIQELWQRRELIQIGEAMAAKAKGGLLSPALIEETERSLLALQLNTRSISLIGADEAVTRVIGQLENPEQAFGIKLGLSPIDDITGGFMPGELWICAGRPGMGKSALSSTGALHIARHGHSAAGRHLGVIEINSEMTVEQMMRRHISDLAYEMHGRKSPTYSAMRKRQMTSHQLEIFRESAGIIRKLPTLKSLYRTGLTVAAIRSLIRRQITSWDRIGIDVGLVSVDHVGLIRASSAARGRTESQGEVAREMKELAGELNIPILALVQLNRQVENRDDKRPQLGDLRDSGEWEENADGAIGCYRESYYAQRLPEPKRHDDRIAWDEKCNSPMIDAIFMKIREGEMQTVKLWADMGHNALRGCIPDKFYDDGPLMAAATDPDTKFTGFSTDFD